MHNYSISRTVAPFLIIAVPIAAMIAWILYHKQPAAPKPQAAPAAQAVSFGGESWAIFRGDPELTGRAVGDLPDKLKPAWTFQTGGEIAAAPVVADGTVYAASMDEHLYALDLADGTEKWRFKADDTLQAAPLYFNGTVYVGSSGGTLWAVDVQTGQPKWSFSEAGEITGSANIADGPAGQTLVVFGSYDNNLYCLDAADGTLVFEHPADNYINGAVAVADNTAFFGSCDAKVYQIPLNDPAAAKTLDTGSYVASNPAIDGGVMYVGNYEGRFLAADIATQEILWSYQHEFRDPFFSSPAVNDEVVVVGCRDKKLYCFDKASGKIRWTFTGGHVFDSSPVICGAHLAVGNNDGRLYLINLKTGKETFSYTLGSSVTGSPAIAGNRLLIGADNGTLYAFTAR